MKGTSAEKKKIRWGEAKGVVETLLGLRHSQRNTPFFRCRWGELRYHFADQHQLPRHYRNAGFSYLLLDSRIENVITCLARRRSAGLTVTSPLPSALMKEKALKVKNLKNTSPLSSLSSCFASVFNTLDALRTVIEQFIGYCPGAYNNVPEVGFFLKKYHCQETWCENLM